MTIKSRMKQRIQHMLWLNILPNLITFSFVYNTGGIGVCQSTGFLTVNFKFNLILFMSMECSICQEKTKTKDKNKPDKTNKVQLIINFFIKLHANRHDIFGSRMLGVVGQCWHWFAKDSRTDFHGDNVLCMCLAPTMLGELCKHFSAMLWRSWNKRNAWSCWLKSLMSFKLCATTPNYTQ